MLQVSPPSIYAAPAPDTFTTKSWEDLPAGAIKDAAYGNNVYIAVGDYGAIIKSANEEGKAYFTTNGSSWTNTQPVYTEPFIWSGMTYIPLRYLSEGIGADVKWDKKAQLVTIKAGSDTLKFWMNKDFMEVNGMKKSVGAKVFVNSDNRTVVPLRFITELLGWNVHWGKADHSITLTKAM
ncbi:hypothetical protein ASF12_27520 [Paenibacillus sp. Leaf72]|nr:hypothetical protein ASF12_27520 [Paenibacillus sp. Leaf72]